MKTGEAARAGDVTSLLIVDDDEAVLKMTKKALVRRGYRKWAAEGEAASRAKTRFELSQ